jgi:hypothetical protein
VETVTSLGLDAAVVAVDGRVLADGRIPERDRLLLLDEQLHSSRGVPWLPFNARM